jgi:beta-N-acetylhexosaminidase
MAKTLSDLGINLNLAPVVDLNLQPSSPAIGARQRSFSADPVVVTENARLFIQAHRQNGILTVLKHFPGHGSALGDTHLGFTEVTQTWQSQELQPYRALIKGGLAEAVMTAHIFHRALDATAPATLSSKVINRLLRQDFGFHGVVISDDLQMGAIRQTSYNGHKLDWQETIRLAITAGCDMLLLANNTEYDEAIVGKSVQAVKNLLAEGKITEARIDESYQRILQFKEHRFDISRQALPKRLVAPAVGARYSTTRSKSSVIE